MDIHRGDIVLYHGARARVMAVYDRGSCLLCVDSADLYIEDRRTKGIDPGFEFVAGSEMDYVKPFGIQS